ncbi:CBS domain-containing protein [Candidatus Bathyarchaeota archaeon]|jgi:CBS domain-containing protein|nr:CBS domain-containing protein [Candidatus Bathyarchaeota archaeon]
MDSGLLVRDVMSKNVKTARPNSTINEVVRKMNKFEIGSIIVADNEKPVGIITERDILRRVLEVTVASEAMKAKEIMSSPIITIDSQATTEEAATLMNSKRIKKIPALEDGKLVGIVTSTDIVRNEPRLVETLSKMMWKKPKE